MLLYTTTKLYEYDFFSQNNAAYPGYFHPCLTIKKTKTKTKASQPNKKTEQAQGRGKRKS